MLSIDDLQEVVHGFFKEAITGPLKSKMAEICHLENRHDVIFSCRTWSDLDKVSETGAEWHVDCGDMWKWKPDVEFQYGGRLGEFNSMSSQSHVSHCRVLPLAEFTVTIPEPHATLQGVRIPPYLKSFFAIFFVLMQFGFWWAADFVSSPIHLLHLENRCDSNSISENCFYTALVTKHRFKQKKTS